MNRNTRITKKERNLLISIVVIAIGLIVLVDIICILAICFSNTPANSALTAGNLKNIGELSSAEKIESTLLSTGMAIIGVAISVWAGLNIANTIARKDIEELRDRMDKDSKQSIDAVNRVYCQIKSQERKITQDEFSRKKQSYDYQMNLYISELLKSTSDLPTKYFVDLLREKFSATPDLPLMELTYIEQLFAQVYARHYARLSDKLLSEIADKGILSSEKLLDSFLPSTDIEKKIALFIRFRIAEFYFYKGYCHKEDDAIECFAKALEWYGNGDAHKDLFDYNLPPFDPNQEYPNYNLEGCYSDRKQMSAYMCNTIGEAHSKIRQAICNKKDYDNTRSQKECLFYCTYAVYWSDHANECYLRNLGCAIERAFPNTFISPKILPRLRSIYREAISVSLNSGNVPRNTFYTYLSLENKAFKKSVLDIYEEYISGNELDIYSDFVAK